MSSLKKEYSCFIVDDNELDRMTIVSFARSFSFIRISAVFGSASQAAEAAKNTPPDILMLDIDMPGINGLDLRKDLLQVPACIFITAHPEYAVESFDLDALDFLVKPLRPERFEKAMARLEQYMEIRDKAALLDYTLEKNSLYIKDGYDHIKLQLDEIAYLEALKDYTGIITKQKKYCVLTPLGSLLKEKPFQSFVRIHRSYAIQKNFIKKISPNEILVNDTLLPIGRSYKKGLEKVLMS